MSSIENYVDEFVKGDCLNILKKMDSESINLIITSPPYADQIKDYGDVVKKIKPENYVDWFLPRTKEFFRVLKNDGSFILNISDKLDGKFQSLYVFKLVIALCEQVGFHLVRDYVWYNPATPPNVFSRGEMGRTKKSHEYCFWFSKSDCWKFYMDPIRKPYCSNMKKLVDGEYLHGDRNANTRPSRHNFDLSHKWNNNGGSDPGSVITLANTAVNPWLKKVYQETNIKHPARFPEKLVEFFILSGSDEEDIILDPFSGSGTTAYVAKKLNRRYIAIDVNPDFCKLGKKWLKTLDSEEN